MIVSHLNDQWSLQITNCPKCENKYERLFTLIFGPGLVHRYGSLRLVRKVIHLHGGKLIVNSRGRVVTFQIVVPLNCNITKQPVPENCVQNGDKAVCANGKGEVIDVKLPLESDKAPFVLLVMADKELSDYLNETF